MSVFPRRAAVLAIVVGAAFAAAPVHAREPATARLSYAVAPGLERCPDERELRDAIAARLGYDPFRTDAPREVAVRIGKRAAGGIDGALDVTGPRPGHREIASPGGDCREVADALAVAAAIAIDPESLNGPRPPDPEPPPPPPPPPPEPIRTEPDRRPLVPATDPIVGRIAVAPEVILGELPAVGVGAVVSAGARWRWISGAIEGEATAPAEHLVEGGAVTASLLTAALVPCGHHGIAFVCLVGRAGVMRAEGQGVARPARSSEPYGAMGARVGVEVPFPSSSSTVSFLANAEVVAPLTRIALRLNGEDAWSAPGVAGRVAIGLGMRF